MTKEQLLMVVEALEAKMDAKEDIAYDHEMTIHERDYAGGYADGMRFAIDMIYQALEAK